jgi:hypothetical protein
VHAVKQAFDRLLCPSLCSAAPAAHVCVLWRAVLCRVLQAGVAVSKWAIEYEQPAADAFKLNNPEAAVFCNNCNAILVVRTAWFTVCTALAAHMSVMG